MFPQTPPPPVVIVQPAVVMPSVWAPPQLVPTYHGYQPVPVWVPPPVVYQPMPTYTPPPQLVQPGLSFSVQFTRPAVCLPGGT